MESSVDPPILISVTPTSNEQADAMDVVSMPNMTDNVTVIQDHSTDVHPPVSILNSPQPLSVLAAEATISYLRSSRAEENLGAIISSDVFRPYDYSWADILLDTPSQPRATTVKRSLSSEEFHMYHHNRPTTSRAVLKRRPKTPRPGVQSASNIKLTQESSSQQRRLPSNRVLPPLEPSRRTRFLITYNYMQNRFRILQFTMETRPNQIGNSRFMRHTFIPRALLNQIRGFGSTARLRRRSALQRAAQEDLLPRSVRRQHQLMRSVSRSRLNSNQRGRYSPSPSTSRYQSEPRAATPVDDINDLVTFTSLPTVMSNSRAPSPSDSYVDLLNPIPSVSSTSLTDNASPPSTLSISLVTSPQVNDDDRADDDDHPIARQASSSST